MNTIFNRKKSEAPATEPVSEVDQEADRQRLEIDESSAPDQSEVTNQERVILIGLINNYMLILKAATGIETGKASPTTRRAFEDWITENIPALVNTRWSPIVNLAILHGALIAECGIVPENDSWIKRGKTWLISQYSSRKWKKSKPAESQEKDKDGLGFTPPGSN